ncbi:MAG TPA: carboxypeptidase-like regulatory domain-containing protein, partial [Bryobacteraceae bacterium]|nr:carboxypeptidase-like regulatory domain-containing protein [Bryobacteraceae bacterium]
MWRNRPRIRAAWKWLALGWLSLAVLLGSEYRGRVTFGGLPVPGATVTATQGSKKFTAITDLDGVYSFPSLSDGTWTIEVEMSRFAPIKQTIAVPPHGPSPVSELQMLPLEEINAQNARVSSNEPKTDAAEKPTQGPDDGLLINGSVNNGAASPFAQFPAFGNNRRGRKGLYTGGIGMTLDNSALDAQPFSLTGQNTPKPAYNRLTGMAVLGGPLKIPHLMP